MPPATLIYNLFPPLFGPIPRWEEHLDRIAEMGFTWVFLNPITDPGLSGSLYAVKDYFSINPLFHPESGEDPEKALTRFLQAAARRKLKVMLEQDYVSLHASEQLAEEDGGAAGIGREVLREVVLPAIEKEVNEGQNFAQLRQINTSLILALWYKQALKQHLLNQVSVTGQRKKCPDFLFAHNQSLFNSSRMDGSLECSGAGEWYAVQVSLQGDCLRVLRTVNK